MGWWPFGRRDAGRHGLGAAVTSIPSGPLVVPVSVLVPAVDPAVAAALVRAQAEAALLPSLPLDEVARVLGVPCGSPAPAHAAVAPSSQVALDGLPSAPPVHRDLPSAPLARLDLPSGPPARLDLPSAPPARLDLPSGPSAEATVPLPDPPSALLVEAPVPVVHVPGQAQPSSRVQLGFRDGSTSSVDDVDQARALEDLARALTSSG